MKPIRWGVQISLIQRLGPVVRVAKLGGAGVVTWVKGLKMD